MAVYSNPSFEIDLLVGEEYKIVKVTLELTPCGTYDEPYLEEDGAALLEVEGTEISVVELNSVEQSRLTARIAEEITRTESKYFTEISQDIIESEADREPLENDDE